MRVKSGMLAAAIATLALGLAATSASAQALPGIPANPVLGTGGQCASGLVVVYIGASGSVCAVPDAPQVGAAPACPDGSVAAEVSAQAVVCLLPGGGQAGCPSSTVSVAQPTGGSLICVLPTNIQVPGAGGCTDGLVPVQILGGSLGCLSALAFGTAGANGANGANAAPTPATPAAPVTTTTKTNSSASTSKKKLYKPTLKLTTRLRGSRNGLVRSSTKKIVVTTIGRRNGRVVRFTKQFSLKRSGPASGARPYSARVKITLKTKGKVSIRITSRGGGSIKTATFKRTVRAR